MIDKLRKYDELFARNRSSGNELSNEIFVFENRGSNLILSAPHATKTFCNKREKCADLFTGAIVKLVGEEAEISTLIRYKYMPQKVLISDFVAEKSIQNHYFLDVHGFNKDIDYDVCLGIADGNENSYPYLAGVVEIIRKYGLKVVVNHSDYSGRFGFTGRYQKMFGKPNVIQIELKKYLRDFYENQSIVQNVTIPMLKEMAKLYEC